MSYSLVSLPGGTLTATLATGSLTGYSNIVIEFSRTSAFRAIVFQIEEVAPNEDNNSVSFSLTAPDVDLLKDSYFRIIGTKDGLSRILQFGSIDYEEAPAPESGGGGYTGKQLVAADILQFFVQAGGIAVGQSQHFSTLLLNALPQDGSTYEIKWRMNLPQGLAGWPVCENVMLDANYTNIHWDVRATSGFGGSTTPIPQQVGNLIVNIFRL